MGTGMHPDRGLFGDGRAQAGTARSTPPAIGGRSARPAASARGGREVVEAADRGLARWRAVPAWTRADDLHAAAAFESATPGLGGDAPVIVPDRANLDRADPDRADPDGARDLAVPAGCADTGQVRAVHDPAAVQMPPGGSERGGGMGYAGAAGDRNVESGSMVAR